MAEQVLVLNQDFEPLNVCHTHRALVLVTGGKAEIVANGRGYITTPSARFPIPSVIRLAHHIHRPRPRIRLSRRAIFRRDGYRCQYCGRETAHLTLDHVVPRSRGGAHAWTNLVSACAMCNRRKGGKTLVEAHMNLLNKPTEPHVTYAALFGIYLRENQEWEPYILV
jgi:5-methylcytosine-specific restriction endonuclease McrA